MKYYGAEVRGCIQHPEEIVEAIPGESPEFWTVYLRQEDGLAYAVSDHRTEEQARHIADLLDAGIQVRGLWINDN